MNLVKIFEVVKDEKGAEEFLRQKGILLTFDRCPYCGHHKFVE